MYYNEEKQNSLRKNPSYSHLGGKGDRDKAESLYMGKLAFVPPKDIPGPKYDVSMKIETPAYSFGPNTTTSKELLTNNNINHEKDIGDKIGPGSYYSKADCSFGQLPLSTKKYDGTYAFGKDPKLKGPKKEINPGFSHSYYDITVMVKKAPGFSFGPSPTKSKTEIRVPLDRIRKYSPAGEEYINKQKNLGRPISAPDLIKTGSTSRNINDDEFDGVNLPERTGKEYVPKFKFGSGKRFEEDSYQPQTKQLPRFTPGPKYNIRKDYREFSNKTFKFGTAEDRYLDTELKKVIRDNYPSPADYDINHIARVYEEDQERLSSSSRKSSRSSKSGSRSKKRSPIKEEYKSTLTSKEHAEKAGDPFNNLLSFKLGSGTRDSFSHLYFPGPLNNAEPTSPGPQYKLHDDPQSPSWSFGGLGIDRSMTMKTGDKNGPIYDTYKYSTMSQHEKGEVNRLAFIPGGDFTKGNNNAGIYTPGPLNQVEPCKFSPGPLYNPGPIRDNRTFVFGTGPKTIPWKLDPTVGTRIDTPGPASYDIERYRKWP